MSPDPQPHGPLSPVPTVLPTWLTWFSASAKSFWLMPQRLATFFWHLWCTFMPQSGVREKQARQAPVQAGQPAGPANGREERTGGRRALVGAAGFPVFREKCI